MSISELNAPIEIYEISYGKDSDGFPVKEEKLVAKVHAKREVKNSTEKWQNKAILQDATCIFKLRYIPSLTLDTSMEIVCLNERYNILSLENVRGRNMYYEIIARKEVLPIGVN